MTMKAVLAVSEENGYMRGLNRAARILTSSVTLVEAQGRLADVMQEALAAPKCDRCGDSGKVTLHGVSNGIGFEMDADDQPCPECASDMGIPK